MNRLAACGLCSHVDVVGATAQAVIRSFSVHPACKAHNAKPSCELGPALVLPEADPALVGGNPPSVVKPLPRSHWGEDRGNLVALVEWMQRTERLDDTTLLDLLRHPAQFEAQWAEFGAEEALKARR